MDIINNTCLWPWLVRQLENKKVGPNSVKKGENFENDVLYFAQVYFNFTPLLFGGVYSLSFWIFLLVISLRFYVGRKRGTGEMVDQK